MSRAFEDPTGNDVAGGLRKAREEELAPVIDQLVAAAKDRDAAPAQERAIPTSAVARRCVGYAVGRLTAQGVEFDTAVSLLSRSTGISETAVALLYFEMKSPPPASATSTARRRTGLLLVGLTSLTRDEVPREGCRYAEEVPSGVQAGRRGGRPPR